MRDAMIPLGPVRFEGTTLPLVRLEGLTKRPPSASVAAAACRALNSGSACSALYFMLGALTGAAICGTNTRHTRRSRCQPQPKHR